MLFDREKDVLVSRFKKKRAAMNSRGVFDDKVNAVRAENGVLAAIGKINMQQLERRSDRHRVDATSARGDAQKQRRAEAGAQTIAARLQADLNAMHDKGIAVQQEWDRKHRQKLREDKLRRGLPAHGTPGGPPGSSPTKHKVKTGAVSPAVRPAGGQSAVMSPTPTKQRLSVDPAPALISRAEGRSSEAGEDADDEARTVAEGEQKPSSAARRQDMDRDILPIMAEGSRGAAPQQQQQQQQPAELAQSSPSSPLKRRGQRPAAKVSVQFSAAEWMQKHWEHQHHSQVEVRNRLRRKVADNAFRPTDAVQRYSERRHWMSDLPAGSSAAKPASGQQPPPPPPQAGGEVVPTSLLYICAVSAHSVFTSPQSDAIVCAELKRGQTVTIAGSGPHGAPEFKDAHEGTWARITVPCQGWALLHAADGAVYLRQVPPEGWSRHAAALSVDRMLHTPSLLEIVDGPLVAAARAAQEEREKQAQQRQQAKDAASAAITPSQAPARLEATPDRKKKQATAMSPKSPASSPHQSAVLRGETARREFRDHARRELTEQRSAVHPEVRLHEVAPPQMWGGDSSDDDDLLQQTDGDGSKEAGSASLNAQKETVELLESVVTFLCREYAGRRVGCASRSTSVRVVRNLCIQALRALAPHIKRESTQGETQRESVGGAPAHVSAAVQSQKWAVEAAAQNAEHSQVPVNHRILVLRTWLKGVEVLLTWDLELPEPFMFSKIEHAEVLARYFCALSRTVQGHCESLLTRWRERRVDAEREAAAAPGPRETSSVNAARDTMNEEWKQHLAGHLAHYAVVNDAQPDGEIAMRVRFFMERFGFVPPRTKDPRDEVSPAVFEDTDGSKQHQNARKEYRRLFFERFGFAPSGPSGSGDVPSQETGRPCPGSLTAVKRIRDLLLGDLGVLSGAAESDGGVNAALRSALSNARDGKSGKVNSGDLFKGTVLPRKQVYRACLRHVAVPLFEHPRYQSRGNAPGRTGEQSLRFGEIVVAIASCRSNNMEWLLLSGGSWVQTHDPDTGQPWLELAPMQDLALWQHSADSGILRSAAGGQSEARRRQRVLLLNDLLSVLNKYLQLCSRSAQRHFRDCVRLEKERAIALDDDSRWKRLFELASDEEDGEGTRDGATGAVAAREAKRAQQAWEVERDVLLRKYGKKRPATVRRKDLLDDTGSWSLEASGGIAKSEEISSPLDPQMDFADAEAAKRHQRFAAQRKQTEQRTRGEKQDARNVRRTGRSRPSADLTGSIPPSGDTEILTEEPPAEEEDEELNDNILDSDGDDPVPIPRGKPARQQMATKLLSELNNVWQNLRIDVQRKLALTDKYTRVQAERDTEDNEQEAPQAKAVQKLVQAERLWRQTDQAVTRRERALQQLTHRLDPGFASYDPAFADDQQGITAALQVLAKTGLEVEQASDRLRHTLNDELTWDGAHVAERLRADYLSVISLVEQAKAAVPARRKESKSPAAGQTG
eukprot:Hpha_TRINITY_DN15338_c0_g5::TRINITY_DN15338_c0_g5_i6::g.89099::m.89099